MKHRENKNMLLGTLNICINNMECVENIKSLRVYVGYDREYCINKNWTDKIDKMENSSKLLYTRLDC